MPKRGNYGDEKNVDKPNAGEAAPDAERPGGTAQKIAPHQPSVVQGENPQTPQLQPGRNPGDGHSGR